METLTSHDLGTLDDILAEIVPRCKIVQASSESEIVRDYIAGVVASAVELRTFLTSPVAAAIVGEVTPLTTGRKHVRNTYR